MRVLNDPMERASTVPSDAPVGGHYENWGEVALQGTVEEGKALHVQHVDLINKQHLKKQT